MSDFFGAESNGLPVGGVANGGRFAMLNANGTTVEWHSINQLVDITLVANTANFVVDDTADYHVDIHGVLTAAGNITASTPLPSVPTFKVVFHNLTTGNFPLTFLGTYVIPRGISFWIWNPTTAQFEFISRQNNIVSQTLDLGAPVVPAAIGTKLLLNTLASAPTTQKGGIADAANSRFVIVEDGTYHIEAQISASVAVAGNNYFYADIRLNGATISLSSSTTITVAGPVQYGMVSDTETCDLKAGDILELFVQISIPNGLTINIQDTYMTVTKL